MAIDPNISGWQSIKAKLKAVIGVANKVENMTIQRGGTTDSVTFAGDSIKINVQDFPRQKPGGGGGGGETVFPFQVVQIDFETVGIRKGTVNNIVPTIGGTALDDDYTQNTITVGSATTFWLSAVLVDEEITAVAIVTSDPGADTATATKQTLGSLTWDSGEIDAISSNLGGSQNVDSCGESHSWNRI